MGVFLPTSYSIICWRWSAYFIYLEALRSTIYIRRNSTATSSALKFAKAESKTYELLVADWRGNWLQKFIVDYRKVKAYSFVHAYSFKVNFQSHILQFRVRNCYFLIDYDVLRKDLTFISVGNDHNSLSMKQPLKIAPGAKPTPATSRHLLFLIFTSTELDRVAAIPETPPKITKCSLILFYYILSAVSQASTRRQEDVFYWNDTQVGVPIC